MNTLASAGRLIGPCLVAAVVLMLAVVPQAPAGEDEPRYFYWVKEKRHALELDTSVVLFVRSADRDALGAAADPDAKWEQMRNAPPPAPKRLEGIVSEIKPSDPVRMWIASLKHEHGPDEMERLVADLAADDAIAFAAPAFRGEFGPTLLKPYVVARYRVGAREDAVRKAAIAAGAGDSIQWEYLGMSRHLRIRPTTRNGFEILGIANRLHESTEIEFAEPRFVLSGKVGFTGGAAQGDQQPDYYYLVGKGLGAQRVALHLDTSRIAIARKGDVPEHATGEERQAAWEQAKIRPLDDFARSLDARSDDLKALDTARMWELRLAADENRADGDMEKLVQHMAEIESIRYATPIFIVAETDKPLFFTGTYTVRFAPDVKKVDYPRILQEHNGGEIVAYNWTGHPRHVLVRPPTRNGFELLRLANQIHLHPHVEFAEAEYVSIAISALIPNDPGFGLQWGLHNTGQSGGINDVDINAPEAWDQLLTNRSITVLILGDGVQHNHPDLNYDIRFGKTFVTLPAFGDGSPETSMDNHETAVAGVVGARTNNAIGVAGVGIGAFLVSAKAFRQTALGPEFSTSGIAEAIRYSLEIGARVTNFSWTFPPSNPVDFAYEDTFAGGVAHFAASGNAAANSVSYPASHPFVIAVGAIDRTGLRAPFSNRGFDLELVAPGVDIYTTDRTGADGYDDGPNPDYAFGDGGGIDGTSFASPYAAGVAALLLRKNPRLTPDQIRQTLQQTALDINPQIYGVGFDQSTGYGLVRANVALTATSSPRIGDANGDGAVNFDDITTVLANWDSDSLDGDANYDGFVNFDDITSVLANFDE